MSCSKPYMDLVKTASGLTPDKPWRPLFGHFDLASTFEVLEWRDLAIKLRDDAFRRLYELGDVETAVLDKRKVGEANYPSYEAMRAVYEPLNAKLNELREGIDPFDSSTLRDALDTEKWFRGSKDFISDLATLSTDIACLLEQIDSEIKKYGVTPRGLPKIVSGGPGKTDGGGGMGILGTAAVLAAGIGAVYLAIVLSRRGSSAPAVKEAA